MQRRSLLGRCRSTAWKAWLGTALAVGLLLAQSFAATHPFDQAAHSNGQPCAVCLSITDLGAGAAAAEIGFALVSAAAPLAAVAVVLVLLSAVPVRRYARGPPSVSFAS